MMLALIAVAAVGLVVQSVSADSNRVALKHRLMPASKVTGGQLQVVGKDGKQLGQCPLEHTTVKAEAAGFVARVDVTQEFTNPLDEPIEAVYVFPLPSDCAVDAMEMTVGDRVITGTVKRREEAKQIYEAARREGKVASLLDQERPNIFTQSVANIMPGARVKIKISYVDVLKYEDGLYEFSFPMVVGPRYMPGGDQVPDAGSITPPITPEGTRAGHDISIDLDINAGVPIGEIKSVLHEVKVDRSADTEARVTLRDESTIPNKDFIVRYRVAGESVRTGFLPNTRSAGDGYFGMILVPPKSPTPEQIAPREMIFVIDSSGSQQGWPIEKAKETMKLCIEKMNPGDTFNVMSFSNEVNPLFSSPQPNTIENRAFATEFLASSLGNGGTEMMKAIDACLTPQPDPKRLRVICFMTDGYVGDDFAILDTIKKKIGNARLFSFGIGNGVNRFLLDGMARMGRGAVEYVTLQEEGKGAAERFYERIGKPVLTDISIDWNGLPVYDTYPNQIPDLFSAQPVIIKGRYDKPMSGTVIIHGRLGGRPWEERIKVSLPGHEEENGALPALWARARIGDLMALDYEGTQRGKTDPKIKEDIIATALSYQLMSQFTSFVAVEEKVVNEGGVQKKVAVPVEMSDGVSYEGIFGDKAEAGQAVYCNSVPSPSMPKIMRVPMSGSVNVAATSPAPYVECDAGASDALKPVIMKPQQIRKQKIETRLAPSLRKLVANGKVGDKARVSIKMSALSETNLAQLRALGVKITSTNKSLVMVIGSVPVARLEELALLDCVVKIAPVR